MVVASWFKVSAWLFTVVFSVSSFEWRAFTAASSEALVKASVVAAFVVGSVVGSGSCGSAGASGSCVGGCPERASPAGELRGF